MLKPDQQIILDNFHLAKPIGGQGVWRVLWVEKEGVLFFQSETGAWHGPRKLSAAEAQEIIVSLKRGERRAVRRPRGPDTFPMAWTYAEAYQMLGARRLPPELFSHPGASTDPDSDDEWGIS